MPNRLIAVAEIEAEARELARRIGEEEGLSEQDVEMLFAIQMEWLLGPLPRVHAQGCPRGDKEKAK